VPAPRASDDPEICVLLLPEALERFERQAQADDLLRAQGVVAVDPPRLSYAALERLPEVVGEVIAARQARRLVRALRRRRGRPRVVVLFDPRQYPLARAVIAEADEAAELWYWPAAGEEAAPEEQRPSERIAELDALAARRATRTFAVPPSPAGASAREVRALDDPVWLALAETEVDRRVTR
jgi:hypothetical protein